MINEIHHLWQSFLYGVLGNRPDFDFSKIPTKVSFISHYDKEHDVHWLESRDLPEFYVSGRTTEDLARHMADTLLVYYDVPTYFARRLQPQVKLDFTNQKTKEHESIELREELHKVLA